MIALGANIAVLMSNVKSAHRRFLSCPRVSSHALQPRGLEFKVALAPVRTGGAADVNRIELE